jgi:chromosome segregation ATPase
MSLFFSSQDDNLIVQTASQLLEPFRADYPEAVQAAMNAIQSGQPIERGGRILVEAVLAALHTAKQEWETEKRSLQDVIEQTKDSENRKERSLLTLRTESNKLMDELESRQEQIHELQETIINQNKLLARLHRRHQAIVRNLGAEEETDDEIK